MDALGAAGLLGLISAESVGGLGQGHRAAARVVERLARECASTAMVVCMHYSATAVLEKLGPEEVRRAIASGAHLSTLAFSEVGSRSQFWAPLSTAERVPGGVALTARKSWATSANHATTYVWSSRPLAATGASTLWLVPRGTPGVRPAGGFDGLGLRGNDSSPITAEGAVIPEGNMLGADGDGLAGMLEIVLPMFNVLCAACSVGLMEGAVARAAAHVTGTGFEHDGTALRDLPTVRAYLARMRIAADMARCLLDDTLDALERGAARRRAAGCSSPRRRGRGGQHRARPGHARVRRRRVPQGGGDRARVPRRPRGERDGAHHRRAVRLHRQGLDRPPGLLRTERAMSGETLILGAVAYDPKVVTIWEGFKRWFAAHDLPFDFVLYSSYESQVEAHLAGHVHVAWNSPLAFLEADRAARARGRRASAIAMRDTDRDLTSVVVVRDAGGARSLADLRGKVVAVGAADSPQATILPLLHLAEAGLEPERDVEVRRFDVLAGKHGDHIGGERDAIRSLVAGEVDAACLIDGNHLQFGREGLFPRGRRAGDRPDGAVRSLQLHRPRRRRGHGGGAPGAPGPAGPFGALPLAPPGDVVRGPGGAPPHGHGGAQGVAARPRQRLRPARAGRGSLRHARRVARGGRAPPGRLAAMERGVDLLGLGLDRGGHLLVKRALAGAAPGERCAVRGSDPHLGVHLRAFCRAAGHGFEDDGAGAFVIACGSAVADRWSGAERAGGVDPGVPGAVVERPPGAAGLAARGALVEAGAPALDATLVDKAVIWSDEAARLYAQATAAQWDPATAIPWAEARELPAEVEDAVVQVMTYLVENETAALLVPARFLARIHPHFHEVMQLLAVQIADEAGTSRSSPAGRASAATRSACPRQAGGRRSTPSSTSPTSPSPRSCSRCSGRAASSPCSGSSTRTRPIR